MDQPLYFQWQNEFLLKTIYPLRETKLRDFLVYFAEIDIWAEYKDKQTSALGNDIKEFNAGRAQAVMAAYKNYVDMREYFLTPDVRDTYVKKIAAVDEAELIKINQLHAVFISYLPKIADVRKEKYFIIQQEPQWVNRRAEARRLVASKKRRVDAIAPDHPRRAIEIKELEMMENVTLAMIDEELIRLRAFIKTFEKIEARKLELFQSREKAQRRKDEIIRKLPALQNNINPLEAKRKTIEDELSRLKNPPNRDVTEKYFATPDVTPIISKSHPQVDTDLLKQINTFHKAMMDEFSYVKEERGKLSTLRNHLYNWQQYLKSLEKEVVKIETNLRNMPANWAKRMENETRLAQLKETVLKVMEAEVSKLTDFHSAVEISVKPQTEIEQTIQAKEKELERIQQNLTVFQNEAETLQGELKEIKVIENIDEESYLTQYSPSGPITAKDIARWKVEEYQATLAQKNHIQLLEDVVQRFLQTPERFPLWLQYMVIHFSGMRYKSAHGSWADPRDFLVRWHTLRIEKELKATDDATIETQSREKTALYASASGTDKPLPRLARADEKDWSGKLEMHLKGIASNGPKTRRASLLALMVDEVKYELSKLSEDQVSETLLAMKNQLPGWLWKEVVMLTPLRVNLVNDPGWEKLTSEEEASKNSYESGELRMMVGKWKEENMSNWREEHGRTQQLIVSRAVCNETAEHCQHLRGHLLPGGLTAKAPWYMKHEKEGKLPGTPRPYFIKPRKKEDYTVGASILWLRFVSEEQNPWRVARPLTTKDGDGLIPAEYKGKRASSANAATSNWAYTETDVVTRTRTYTDANKQKVNQEQWLRWIHEATVAEVAETADGPVVLTFETALPDDDPGLSSIGLFRIWLSNALFTGTEDNYNGSFIGFVPEGQLPVEGLESMLDWNKILLRQIMTSAELDSYRKKYIRREA